MPLVGEGRGHFEQCIRVQMPLVRGKKLDVLITQNYLVWCHKMNKGAFASVQTRRG